MRRDAKPAWRRRLMRGAAMLVGASMALCFASGAEAACGNGAYSVIVSQGIELGTFTRPNLAPATVTIDASGARTVPGTIRIASDESIAGRIPHAATVTISGAGTSCTLTLAFTTYSTTSLSGGTSSLGLTFTTNAAGSDVTLNIGASQLVNPTLSANAIGGTIGISVTRATGNAAQRTQTASIPVTAGGLTGVNAVISSLTLTATAPTATMPHIVKPSTGNTATLQMTCGATGAATIAYGTNANPFAGGTATAPIVVAGGNTGLGGGGSTGACAQLSAAGQPGYSFSTVVGASSGVTAGVTLSGNCSTAGAATVLSGGAAEIYCGANVSMSSAVAAGAYTGAYTVTVTYD